LLNITNIAMGSQHSAVVVKEVDNLCECSICLKPFDDPRSLPCLHTYCLKCIEKWGNTKPGSKITCPFCRTNFNVPQEGLSGLPKNFFIGTLLQLKQLSHDESVPVVCSVCAAAATEQAGATASVTNALASAYCCDCQEKYCENCAKVHRNSKLSRSHKLIGLQEFARLKDNEERCDLLPSMCEKHVDQSISLFCSDCKVAMCVVCDSAYHKQHKTADIKEIAEEFRQQMISDREDIVRGIGRLQELLQALEKQRKCFTKCAAEAEAQIDKRAEEIKQMIERNRKALSEELATNQNGVTKQFDSLKDDITQMISLLENAKKYTEELSSKGTATDVTRQTLPLRDRIKDLLKFNDIERTWEINKSAGVKFVTSQVLTINSPNVVGKIECKV
jgi:tripartite motif-containing protein 2/3